MVRPQLFPTRVTCISTLHLFVSQVIAILIYEQQILEGFNMLTLFLFSDNGYRILPRDWFQYCNIFFFSSCRRAVFSNKFNKIYLENLFDFELFLELLYKERNLNFFFIFPVYFINLIETS